MDKVIQHFRHSLSLKSVKYKLYIGDFSRKTSDNFIDIVK